MNSSASSNSATIPKRPQFGGQIQAFFQQDRGTLFLLYACALAVICTAIDPPFYSLTSQEVQAFLRETDSSAPLIVAVEFLLIAVMTLAGGTMGDLYGRRRVLLIGLGTIFTMNVLGALTLDTPAYLTVHRLNVVAGACVLSMCVAIVALAFESALRPFAFGILFGLRSVAIVLSSTFAYWFERWGVRWLSFVPVAVLCIITMALVLRFVTESRAGADSRKSLAFVNLLLLGIVFVVAFLILSAVSLLNNILLALLAIITLGLAGATVRWWVQRRQYYAANDIFSRRDVAIAIVAGMMISGIQGAFLFEFWTFNAEVLGFNWFFNSLRVAPYVIGLLLGSVLVLQVLQRLGVRGTLAGGMVLMAAGLLAMSLMRADTPYILMLVPIFVMGIGFGLATPVRAQVVLSAPPANLIGAAAAVNNATGMLGYALGIAISSGFVMRLADASMVGTLEEAGIDPLTIDKIVATLPDYATRAAQATYAVLPQAAQIVPIDYASAWMDGLNNLYLSFGLAMLIGAVVVFFVKSRRELPAQPTAGE
jgi:MFS family permease